MNIAKNMAEALLKARNTLEWYAIANEDDGDAEMVRDIDALLAEYKAGLACTTEDSSADDELLAELSSPDKRWTVEHNNWSDDHAKRIWFVRDNKTCGEVRFPYSPRGEHAGEGYAGKRRAIAVARALNEAESEA